LKEVGSFSSSYVEDSSLSSWTIALVIFYLL
jgi:hypothetical protein